MTNVFAQALSVIFADPNMGEDALYCQSGTGLIIPVRVLLRAPDVTDQFADTRVIIATNVIEVRRADVALPVEGDRIEIGTQSYQVWGEPVADQFRQIWVLAATVMQ